MRDPYEILGISHQATDEDVKKAYRNASRKYHPDANPDNPKAAEEKFKEIQQAYKEIMDQRNGKGSQQQNSQAYGQSGQGTYGNPFGNQSGQSSYGNPFGEGDWQNPFGNWDFGGFGNFGYQQKQNWKAQEEETDSAQMRAVVHYINENCYEEAIQLLGQIEEKSARWYYLSSLANGSLGNNVIAKQHIETAVSMEPGNRQYQQLKDQMEGKQTWYQQQNTSYEKPDFSGGNFCMKLCILNLICNCFCGGGGY